jgi:hypothetical protein
MNSYHANMTTRENKNPSSNDRKKRRADDSHIISDDDRDSYPSFMIVEPTTNKKIDQSIFGIYKLLKCAVGDVKNAKMLRNESVLIEMASRAQAENALKTQNWVDIPVKITPHRSLNSCKGVTRCRDLRDCSDEEVLEALNHEGVTQMMLNLTKNNGSAIPSNTFVLTFNRPTLQQSVKAAYLHIPVEPFIPNPLRCFNCQKFGHRKSSRHHNAICSRCGNEGHSDSDYQQQPRCVNCSNPHPSFSKECPEWIKQRVIIQIKNKRNISFSEAKQLSGKQHTHSACSTQSAATYSSVCKQTANIY